MIDKSTWPLLSEEQDEPNALAALRRFARPSVRAEKCELCGAALWPQHTHLIDLKSRRLVCSCEACAILFSGQQSPVYRRVPQRIEFLPDFRLSDAQWDSLLIPINLAFFFHSTPAERVLAVYPSPAGAMESLLGLEAWQALAEENPVLRDLQPDVEALLANRLGHGGEYYRLPIDECYKLVGLIRLHWRGLSGGTEVWDKVRRFFVDLKERREKSCPT
jgi:hypothetical protein